MAALGDSRGNGRREADRAGPHSTVISDSWIEISMAVKGRLSWNDYFCNILPLEVDVGIGKVSDIVTGWMHRESVLCIDEFFLVPDGIGPSSAPSRGRVHRVARVSWGKSKVEQGIHI